MTKKNVFVMLIAATVLACIIGWVRPGQASSKVTWEYETVHTDNPRFSGDATLNELGAQGWELAGVAAWNNESNRPQTILYFKRAK